MDKMISRFVLEGVSKDTHLFKTKASAESTLTSQARDQGYVPLLDLDPTWYTDWQEDWTIKWKLVIQCVYVGVDEAWLYSGATNGKLIPFTQKHKSKPS